MIDLIMDGLTYVAKPLSLVTDWFKSLDDSQRMVVQWGIGVATAAGAGSWAFARSRFRSRVRLVAQRRTTHHDFQKFVDLYERTIDDRIRISPSEIRKALEQKRHDTGIVYKLFLCKKGEDIWGFAQLMYDRKQHRAFISYFGVDDQNIEAKKEASRRLAHELMRFVRRRLKKCRGLVFEVESPLVPGLSVQDISERRARIRRFKDLSTSERTVGCEVDLKYFQPEIPGDSPLSNEHEMRLMYVALGADKDARSIPKPDLLELIDFVYFKIYAPVYKDDHELYAMYCQELRNRIQLYEKSLPQEIRLLR